MSRLGDNKLTATDKVGVEKPMSTLEGAVLRNHDSVALLHDIIDVLHDRLRPIMSMTPTEDGSDKDPVATYSEVVENINANTNYINGAQSKLGYILERIDL